jgi:hypothetical protein
MTSYVIAGAGPAGLYTAYRLLSANVLQTGDTLQLIEWSDAHVGGRIHTYYFEGGDANGQYVEAGGMRFSTDPNFPNSIQSGHIVLQNLIVAMNLQGSVVPFVMSNPQRLYYLRGVNFYEQNIPSITLPYQFDASFTANGYQKQTAEAIFGDLAANFTQTTQSWTRSQWCDYFAGGVIPAQAATATFPAGMPIQNVGYWNLLYDQLGDEGFDYVTDANGFTSNTINWNSADAMQSNTEFGDDSVYSRIQGGYSLLFQALASEVSNLGMSLQGQDPIVMATQLAGFEYDPSGNQFTLTLVDANGAATTTCDRLVLAMPRRSLELVAAGSSAANPLNQEAVKFYIESSLDQPAYKVAMLFDDPWWSDTGICAFPPNLTDGAGGPTMTDLPLRQIYYFGNDAPGATGGGPYVLLASYDDMQFASFWQEMEITGDRTGPASMDYQPLNGPTALDPASPMVTMLLSQLALVHGANVADIPAPTQAIFQDWGRNPYGAGYHGWAAHYNICEAMEAIRWPGAIVGDNAMALFIVGSCYSIDQAWVEGALCTAESVLQQYFGLAPFAGVPQGYTLICSANGAGAGLMGMAAAAGDGDTEPAGT